MHSGPIAELEALLVYLEEHMEASEGFYGSNLPRDLEGVYELYQEAFDTALQLKEKVERRLDTPDDWQNLAEVKSEASRAMAREGHRNWVAQGPTRSALLNQIVFTCQSPDLSSALPALAQMVGEVSRAAAHLCEQEPRASWARPMKGLAEACAAFDEDDAMRSVRALRAALEVSLPALGSLLDLSVLDHPVRATRSWFEALVHLCEAYNLEEVGESAIIVERDLALGRLEVVAGSAFGLGSAGDQVAEILLDIQEVLKGLEEALGEEDALPGWLEDLGGLWEELEKNLRQGSASFCNVCSHALSPGDKRCPNCQNPILSLHVDLDDVEADGSGSGLIDELEQLHEKYLGGHIDLESWRSKLQRTERKINSVLETYSKQEQTAQQQSGTQHLQGLLADIRALAEAAADPEREGAVWQEFRAKAETILGFLRQPPEAS